jgi:hypothetical protein
MHPAEECGQPRLRGTPWFAGLLSGSCVAEEFRVDEPIMLIYAAASLAAGHAMTLAHNVWSGGTLPVAVTLVWWLIVATGLRSASLLRSAHMENACAATEKIRYRRPIALGRLPFSWNPS